ncbi:MAG: NAD-dependent epimerase/dehydratase family protein [Saprospiraceae bacterium]|nr:NAD-dependent epimerase/dehydratase family protein [Saprospiraceae bacterium]
MKKEKILIIGANGQIGSVLTDVLKLQYGSDHVIPSDIRVPEKKDQLFERLDVLDKNQLATLVNKHNITQIYHLAAILSAKGELHPQWAWDVNMNSLFNVLELAKEKSIQLFFPSSIAVFGKEAPKNQTPQYAPLTPTTVYGISKVAGENWCQYYHDKYGVDVRSIRYPGIIGYQSLPGGGTTDYAVEIYHAAVKGEAYTSFLSENTTLPMIYMDDAIKATIAIMEAPQEQIKIRTSYNLSGMSFSPIEIAQSIQQHYPDFKVSYAPDFREAIAQSWPSSIDDSAARADWGWKASVDLNMMTSDMIKNLKMKYLSTVSA